MTVKHRTVGTASQLLTCQLEPGQCVYAEPGKFLWKTTNVALETRLTKPSTESGGGGGGRRRGWRADSGGLELPEEGHGRRQARGRRRVPGPAVLHRPGRCRARFVLGPAAG